MMWYTIHVGDGHNMNKERKMPIYMHFNHRSKGKFKNGIFWKVKRHTNLFSYANKIEV